RIGQPALPGLIDTQLLGRHRDTLGLGIGHEGVDIVGLETEMVDLVAFLEPAFAFEENLDKGAVAKIEIESDPLVAAVEVELWRNAANIPVKCLDGVKIAGKNTGMRHLLDEGCGHIAPPESMGWTARTDM